MQKKINILLVDDHVAFTEGLKSLLATQPDLHVVASIEKTEEAIRRCHDHPELDLILMDINFPRSRLNGFELTSQIKVDFPKIKVEILLCSVNEDAVYVQRAKEVGASGYVFKYDSPEHIFRAIREVAKGGAFWPPIIDDGIDPPPLDLLPKPTPTEMEVLKYLAIGMQSDQIGVELAMLEATVSTHRRNIRQKYGINTPGKLTLFAKKCMELYGIPPNQKFSEDLTNKLTDEFKKQIKKRMKERIKEQTGIEVEPADEVTMEIKFADGIGEFNNATNRALIRTVEETLRTIRQCTSVCKVSIHLTELNASLVALAICTDAKGFDVAQNSGGSTGGMDALKRILGAIGGKLVINPLPDNGTTVTATLRRTAQR